MHFPDHVGSVGRRQVFRPRISHVCQICVQTKGFCFVEQLETHAKSHLVAEDVDDFSGDYWSVLYAG